MNEVDQIKRRMAARKKNQFSQKENFMEDNETYFDHGIENKKYNLFYNYTLKVMILIIVVLTIAVFNRLNPNNTVLSTVFNKDMDFAVVKNLFVNTIGNVLPFDYIDNDAILVSSSNNYTLVGENLYKNNDNTALAINSGIVIFVGSDDANTKKVVVQLDNGVKVTYSLVEDVQVGIYDRLTKNQLIGFYKQELMMTFERDGIPLTYEQAQTISY